MRARVLACAPLAIALACAGPSERGPASWRETALDPDASYLPLGAAGYARSDVAWTTAAGSARADAYVPDTGRAPVVVVLPGAAVVKERYTWLGKLLASHGMATFVVQPSGTFPTAELTTSLLQHLGGESSSAVAKKLDLGRVLLVGHSMGAAAQAGLTDVATCAPALCPAGTRLPDGVRGLVMLGFHAQVTPDAATPLAAADLPWLLVVGSVDGTSTPEKVRRTYERIVDRPVDLIEVTGMNHYQLTDYVDPTRDRLDDDGTPAVANKAARATVAGYVVAFAKRALFADGSVPDDLGAAGDARVVATRKAALGAMGDPRARRVLREQVGPAGLDGEGDDCDVVAAKSYAGALYLLTRNETQGSEVFRVAGGKVERVPFPAGAKHGVYGNRRLNGLYGAMEVFQGKLWVGFSSGTIGTTRASTGAEVWTWDGASWEPVVASRAGDARITVAGIDGCDGASTTARLTVSGAAWTPDEWKGARLDDLEGAEGAMILDVVGSGTSTLTFASRERAVDAKVDCAAVQTIDGARALRVGDALRLRRGRDHAGFGDTWNKAITGMAVEGGRLYVSTALNYVSGARIYATSDGKTFDVAVPYEALAVPGEATITSSSITALHASDVLGAPRLYFAAIGNGGYGARLFAREASGAVTPLIDNVAGRDGLLSAGFGRGIPQIAALATFEGRLWLGTFGGSGLHLLSASRLDGAGDLRVDVGDGAAIGPGFGDPNQLGARLDVAGGQLWVGALTGTTTAQGLTATSANAWRKRAGGAFERITGHAFGYNAISTSRVVEHDGALYAVAGSGAPNARVCLGPVRLYALRDEGAR